MALYFHIFSGNLGRSGYPIISGHARLILSGHPAPIFRGSFRLARLYSHYSRICSAVCISLERFFAIFWSCSRAMQSQH